MSVRSVTDLKQTATPTSIKERGAKGAERLTGVVWGGQDGRLNLFWMVLNASFMVCLLISCLGAAGC